MNNKFSQALKQDEPSSTIINNSLAKDKPAQKSSIASSRVGTKHIGGYFDPVVSRQLKSIALDEDNSVQSLIAEAIDMLFQSRGKPMIASKAEPSKT